MQTSVLTAKKWARTYATILASSRGPSLATRAATSAFPSRQVATAGLRVFTKFSTVVTIY